MALDLKLVKALREETGLGMMDCKKALEEAGGDKEAAVGILRKKGMAAAEKRGGRSADQGRVAQHIAPDGSGGSMVEMRCESDFVARSDDFVRTSGEIAEAAAREGPEMDLETFLGKPSLSGERSVEETITDLVSRVGEKVVLQKMATLPAPKGEHHRVGGYVHHNGRVGSLVRLSYGKEASGEALGGMLKDLAMHVVAATPSPAAVSRDEISGDVLEKEEAIQADTEEIRKKPEQIRGKILKGKMERFIKDRALLEQQLVTAAEEKLTVKGALERLGKELSDSLVVEGFLRFELGE